MDCTKIKNLLLTVCLYLVVCHYGFCNNVIVDDPVPYHPHQYFVQIDESVSEIEKDQLLAELNSIEIWENEDINLALWQVSHFPYVDQNGVTIFDIDGTIAGAKSKTEIDESSFNINHYIGNDQLVNPNIHDVSFDHSFIHGEREVTISIIDTGISNIADNSTSEYNFNLTNYTGFDYVDNDPLPEDTHGHGSHIAGIIYHHVHKNTPNSSKVKFDIRKTHDSEGFAFMSNVVFALLDAVDEDASIINMSFSLTDTYSDTLFYPLQNAIEYARKKGVLIITSAGNNSLDNDDYTNTSLPSSFPSTNILSVAALDDQYELSHFSNYGNKSVDVAIFAEGVAGPGLQQDIVYHSGTSQAAALVSAIACIKATHTVPFNSEETEDEDEILYIKRIKCEIIESGSHRLNLFNKVYNNSVINFSDALAYSTGCQYNIKANCLTQFINENRLVNSVHQSKFYDTDHSIESEQIILPDIQLTYDAKLGVALLSGFEVKSGAQFQIATHGCETE